MTPIRTTFATLAFIALSGGAVLAECSPATAVPTITPGVLTVAITSYAPSTFVDSNGDARGIDNDILTEFARRNCLEFKAVAVDPAAAIQYVLSRQADLSTGSWYRTGERAKMMNLSAPIYKDQLGIFSPGGQGRLEDFDGQVIGTVQGYAWVNDARRVLGERLKLYPNSTAMHQDIRIGRLAAGLDGYATGAYAALNDALDGLQVQVLAPDDGIKATIVQPQVGYPYGKWATEFGAALDGGIAEMHADGTIVRILAEYGLAAEAADVGPPTLIE